MIRGMFCYNALGFDMEVLLSRCVDMVSLWSKIGRHRKISFRARVVLRVARTGPLRWPCQDVCFAVS